MKDRETARMSNWAGCQWQMFMMDWENIQCYKKLEVIR